MQTISLGILSYSTYKLANCAIVPFLQNNIKIDTFIIHIKIQNHYSLI